MPIITRKLEFDAGHRVLGHEGKCRHLHGHRYVAEITVEAQNLDSLGRVVDFGVIKGVVGRWIDEHWDHNMILHPDDPLLDATVLAIPTDLEVGQRRTAEPIFGGKIPYIMPRDAANPTAENMAGVLCYTSMDLLPDELKVKRVRLYETPNCWADHCRG